MRDYTCVVVKHERVKGKLLLPQVSDAKVRHPLLENGVETQPRAVYIRFREPAAIAGREVLWVEGENNNDLIIRRGGRRFGYLTVRLSPGQRVRSYG